MPVPSTLSDKPLRYIEVVIEVDSRRNRPPSGHAELFPMADIACGELGISAPARTHLLIFAIRELIFSFAILSADEVSLAATEPFKPCFPGLLKSIKMNCPQVNFV